MIKKYNFALIPISKNAEISLLANKFSYLMAANYLTGASSLPHVTLYQFHAEENDIHFMWEKVIQKWQYAPLNLIFNKLSCITYDKQTYWISLIPNHLDVLNKMHAYIAHVLSLPIKKSFDPHMTLLNTKNQKCEIDVAEFTSYEPLSDTFMLSLGLSDEVGQLKEIIYKIK